MQTYFLSTEGSVTDIIRATGKILTARPSLITRQCLWCAQLYKKLISKSPGWDNYPLVIQWEPYVDFLPTYAFIICQEALSVCNMGELHGLFSTVISAYEPQVPHWIVNRKELALIVCSHRNRLAYRYPDEFGYLEPKARNMAVHWPMPYRYAYVHVDPVQQAQELMKKIDIPDELDGMEDAVSKAANTLKALDKILQLMSNGTAKPKS